MKRNIDVQVPLGEMINAKIQKIATKDMYKEFMELVNYNINKIQIINEELRKEFDLNLYYDKNIDDILDKAIIANWIYENKEKYNLFASSNIGQLRRMLAYNLGRALEKINGTNEMDNTEKITITEEEFPYHYKIEYIPKKIGLEKYCVDLIGISSPYKVYLFF